jgi:hypothetical protein
MGRSGLIVLFKEPERLPDDLAGRVVAAGIHLRADEFSSSGVRENIHGPGLLQGVSYPLGKVGGPAKERRIDPFFPL